MERWTKLQSFLAPHEFLGIGAAMLLHGIDSLPHLVMTQHAEKNDLLLSKQPTSIYWTKYANL